MLFHFQLAGKKSWAKVFQSAEAFNKVVAEILKRESLPFAGEISNLTPGTNAAFRSISRTACSPLPNTSSRQLCSSCSKPIRNWSDGLRLVYRRRHFVKSCCMRCCFTPMEQI